MKSKLLITILCITILITLVNAEYFWDDDLKEDIIAVYNFDENESSISEQLFTGIYNGSLFSFSDENWTDGKVNSALNFNRTSFINLDNKNLLLDSYNEFDPFSFSVWINMHDNLSSADSMTIYSLKDTTDGSILTIRRPLGDYLVVFGHRGISNCVSWNITDLFNDGLLVDNWVHLIGTYNGDGIGNLASYNLYINGSLYEEGKDNINTGGTSTNSVIGIDDDKLNKGFNGTIDELMFWNKTLSTSDVEYLYNNGSGYNADYPLRIYNINYENTTTAGSSEIFSVNLSYDNSLYTGIITYLVYNNTNYSTSIIEGIGNNFIFSLDISIPIVYNQTEKQFYFLIKFSNATGSYYYNTSTYNQTLNLLNLDDCSDYTDRIYNFTMYDEESLEEINGTIEYIFEIYGLGTNNLISSFNNTINYTTGGDFGICVEELNRSYTLKYRIKHYGNESYFKKYKISQNYTLDESSKSQVIKLYNLKSLSGNTFKVIIVGSSIGNNDLLIDAQREYIGLNEYISVENSESDSTGEGILHLVQSEQVYNFLVSYNGELLGSFNKYNVQCQNQATEECTITLNLASLLSAFPQLVNYGNISLYYELDEDNNKIYTTYSSTDGAIRTINQNITKLDGYGNTTICSGTSTGVSGTITCNIPVSYQNETYISNIFSGDDYIDSKYFSTGSELLDEETYGVELYIQLLLFSCLVFLFIPHPIFIIIGSIIGTLLSLLLIFFTGGSTSAIVGIFIFYLIGGIIAIIQIAKKM